MFKVSVQNNIDGLSFAGIFPDQESADKWIAEQVSQNSWGKKGEYTIVISDATVEVTYKKALQKVQEEIQKGAMLKLELQTLLKTKLFLKEITLEQAKEFAEHKDVEKVERYLREGYLGLVKPLMQSGDFPILTEEEKQNFIAKL